MPITAYPRARPQWANHRWEGRIHPPARSRVKARVKWRTARRASSNPQCHDGARLILNAFGVAGAQSVRGTNGTLPFRVTSVGKFFQAVESFLSRVSLGAFKIPWLSANGRIKTTFGKTGRYRR